MLALLQGKKRESLFSYLSPHQAAEMRDVSARYLSISGEVNDPIRHCGQRPFQEPEDAATNTH